MFIIVLICCVITCSNVDSFGPTQLRWFFCLSSLANRYFFPDLEYLSLPSTVINWCYFSISPSFRTEVKETQVASF